MPRNTFLLVIVLSVAAAFVAGANITRLRTGSPAPKEETPAPAIPATESGTASAQLQYKNSSCGVLISYPAVLSLLESPGGSAVFTNTADSKDTVLVTCEKNVPRPGLPKEQIELFTAGTLSATLYHDVASKEGTPVDKFIFRHPGKNLDIFIAGFGKSFRDIIANITLLP